MHFIYGRTRKKIENSAFSVTAETCCHFNVAARAGRVPFKEVFRELTYPPTLHVSKAMILNLLHLPYHWSFCQKSSHTIENTVM
jgi:hypothetical protein